MQTTGPAFLAVGILLIPLSFLHRNPLRRQMLQLIAAFGIGTGVVFIVTRQLSSKSADTLLAGYTILILALALWFGRRQLILARQAYPSIYAERKRGAIAFVWLAVIVVAVSLIGYYALGIRSLRFAWVGGVLLSGLYLWERAGIRSLERDARASQQDH